MIRIKEDRCGYTGYTCTAVPKLNPIFTNTEFSYDPVPGHDTGLDVSQLDNYLNIPELMEGFVMTLPQIPDMEAANLEVPELSCRIDFDPFSDDAGATKNETKVGGFMDFYQAYTLSGTTITAEVEGGTIASYALQTTLPDFETDYILQPGLLEPMVDTSFAPVPIDQITAPEAGNNGNLLAIGMLQKWRTLVNGRINDLYRKVRSTFGEYDAAGLRDMLNKQNKKSPCVNFTMTRTSGQNIIKIENPDRPNIPMYSISGGTVYVDGTKVEVSGYTESGHTTTTGMFTAYLEIKGSTVDPAKPYIGTVKVITGNTVSETLSPLPKNTEDTYNFLIGGLRLVPPPAATQDPDYSGGTRYKFYELVVGDCLENIDLSGGTGGGTTVSWEYDGPFKVVTGTTSGYVSLAPFDPIGATPQPYTGKVVNGNLIIDAPVKDVQITGTTEMAISVTKDLYAQIDFRASTVSYVVGSTAVPPTQESADPDVIFVRLARVSLGGINYETVTLVDYGLIRTDSSVVGQPAIVPLDFVVDPQPSLINIPVGPAVPFWSFGNVYEVSGGTLTGRYGQPASATGSTVGATVVATQMKDIIQIQYGDIVVGGTTSSSSGSSEYMGPFRVSVDANDVYHISCPSCGSNENSDAIIGWYSIDGQYETEVTGDYSGPVGTATAVYFHKTATTMTIDTTPGNTTDPTDYTVRLARISGGTAYQLHFGNIFIDGRWNTPEPPPPYTVSATDGTGDGSLFSALSTRSDPEIYIAASLNGQPLDFNGASVL